ncbi:MAG: tetratricopeptide repeat protein [Chitinispirillales bacterium]|jgi:hypothetical protein|nr:tetratricopeptide repeat protein [Chitinispirillales bacterium]
MKKFGLTLCLCVSVLVFCCAKKNGRDVKSSADELTAPFGTIAKKTYSIGDLIAFSSMQYHHPVREMRGRFPGSRNTTTLFIETQVLYQEAQEYKKQVMNGLEWKWKEIYIPGQIYQVGVIDKNMGAADEEIYAYYKKHKNELLMEFGLGQSDSMDFNRARISIIKKLFLTKYPPSSEFSAIYPGFSEEDLKTKWFEQMAGDRAAFFRDILYKKRFGADFPKYNTKSELVGAGKLISEPELNVVMSWIAKGQNVSEDLVVAKMVSWILFADEAKSSGYVKAEGYKKLKEQFEKYEIVRHYVNEVLGDKIKSDFTPNQDFIKFAIADKMKNPSFDISQEEIENYSDTIKTEMYEAKIIEYIHQKRAKANVVLMQKDYVDIFGKSPSQIKSEADSLAANQNTERAKKLYRDLTEWYLYSPEGKNAFLELAKLQTDAKSYTESINSYRKYLLYGGANSKWCEVFFMIGYVYAEQLEKYPFAAMNYRWILQNQPGCNLSSDAEFMYLHLGEPIVDVEELRQESIRQGRE